MKKNQKVYMVTGMHCTSCASLIEINLEEKGYRSKVNYANEELTVFGKHLFKNVREVLLQSGYDIILK